MVTTTSMGRTARKAKRGKIRRRYPKRQFSKQSCQHAAFSLEQHRFNPIVFQEAPSVQQWKHKEREVMASLSHLADLYKFPMPGKIDIPYPGNIEYALTYAQSIMKHRAPDVTVCILGDDKIRATMATYVELDTRYDLYYLPLEPVDRLMKMKGRKPEKQLMWSILSYLFSILKIDSFAEEDSYLHYFYAMIKDAEVFDDPEDYAAVISEVGHALQTGEQMQYEMLNKNHLEELASRVKKFKARDELARQLQALACKTLALYQKHPDRSLAQAVPDSTMCSESPEDYVYPFLRYGQRFSFTWQLTGDLADQIDNYVTGDQQEQTGLDKPISLQIFNQPQSTITMNLDFETEVIDLLENLCDFLMHTI